ncbi:hypothetical protein MLD38_003246 [Melastoma candidum]|uniref:Uncharacterized protein n=1 Tax=Melastoma candidum TaxID=119954 RepID=A0ACB9SAI8_9MYRT|nr:hypothetical protein MLD38_003246 [Melastoma candidum]
MEEDGSISSIRKTKVKRGWLAVHIGTDDGGDGMSRFVIPIPYLNHPLFKGLLDRAHETYGYNAAGPLRLPCSVDDFLHLRWLIEKESACPDGPSQHLHGSLSFRSC